MYRPIRLPSRTARQQAERKALWNEARARDAANFFTLGYSGRSATDLVLLAKSAGVQSIIDIRFSPVSVYKPELSKRNFSRTLEAAGLAYLHVPHLGVPPNIRVKAAAQGQREPIWEWYDQHVAGPFCRNLTRFFNMADHPVALMCVEADPTECHRHRLSAALEQRGLQGFDL